MGMMRRRVRGSGVLASVAALCLAACATASAPGPAPGAGPAKPAPRPAAYQSEDFIVTFAQPGDTPEALAERYLGGADKGWMIEDYTGLRAFAPGQEIVIPRRPWNLAGVTPGGYQIVRFLKTNGYRVVSLAEFIEFSRLNRQLPQRAVVLTFDDGYRAFKDLAYPVLKELGFTATLFIYTDWVGAGRGALSWADLRELAAAGMDIQGHSKTHADLRRAQGETEAQYARRMQAELDQQQAETLERDGQLRRAAEEWKIALAIAPGDARARESLRALQARIDQVVAERLDEGRRALARGVHVEARRKFLAALA